MSRRHVLASAAVVAVAVTVSAVAAVLVLGDTHSRTSSAVSSVSPGLKSVPAIAAPVGVPQRGTILLAAIREFAAAYGFYLDGGPVITPAESVSITAAAQATQAGQIPATFRDGYLKIEQLESLESTCCSASVTVVLANREERYPFGEQLLLERRGWVVDQITPPDLSTDRNLRPTAHAAILPPGSAAATVFAITYVNYRSGESSTHPAMTQAAAKQIIDGTDSLAGQLLRKRPAKVSSIRFGPPSGEEFAATAAMRTGRTRVTFSFLMVKTAGGWRCGQFL